MKQADIFQLPKDIEKMDDGSNLLVKPMEVVMRESMMPYAEHVILDRALPRVEDGLKPVQRRILYSMYEQGNMPDKPTRKSARIVGDCMGRYHPHGDSSIYDAMVRMAQDFQLNVPLIQGQGNFGNIDGDSAAAMRYTEAKLAPIAIELLRDIEKDTVRWSRNFDDTTKEPDMLPGRYPNLLVNGSTGIAVGLATNIPPHNLTEVIDGVAAYIDDKNISLDQMMKIIKGPDFPTGGFVIPGDGLKQAYETGKGKILIRAKMHVEVAPGDKRNIVITEIPYGLSKADLLMKIAAFKDDKDKKEFFQGNIAEIVDESDKEGMRAVIKLKKDADVNKTIAWLFKYTQLEVSYGINMVAIADGKPQQMGLLDIIAYYVTYQRDVILKRSKFELEDAKARAHILEGLVIAVNNIDEVIQIIKSASSTSDAKQKLRNRFDLSERQAQAILDLRLARLTKLEVNKLETELAELHQQIKRLGIIINSKKEQMNLVKTELLAIKRNYKNERKSEIVKDTTDYVVPSETDEKPVENCVVCLTADKTIKRIALKSFNKSDRDPVKLTNADVVISATETTTDSKLMLFTNFGNVMQIAVEDLKDVRFRDEGTPLFKLFPDAQIGEVPVSMFLFKKDAEPTSNLIVYTRQGMVKRSSWADYMLQKSVFQGFKCKEKDEVLRVECEKENSQIFFVTNKGGCVRFKTDEVPLQTRVTGGVMGINLADGEYLVFAGQVDEANGQVLMVTDKGFCKRLAVKEITIHARNCKGAKGIEFGNNGTCIVFADYVGDEGYSIAIKDRANTYVVDTKDVSVESKNHKGKLPQGKRGGIVVESVLRFYTNGDKTHVE